MKTTMTTTLVFSVLLGIAAGCGQPSSTRPAGASADSVAAAPRTADAAAAGKKGVDGALSTYRAQYGRLLRLWRDRMQDDASQPARFALLDIDADGILELYAQSDPDADVPQSVAALFCCGGDSVQLVCDENKYFSTWLYPHIAVSASWAGGRNTHTYFALEGSRARRLDFYRVEPMDDADTSPAEYYYRPGADDADGEPRKCGRADAEKQLKAIAGGNLGDMVLLQDTVSQWRPIADIAPAGAGARGRHPRQAVRIAAQKADIQRLWKEKFPSLDIKEYALLDIDHDGTPEFYAEAYAETGGASALFCFGSGKAELAVASGGETGWMAFYNNLVVDKSMTGRKHPVKKELAAQHEHYYAIEKSRARQLEFYGRNVDSQRDYVCDYFFRAGDPDGQWARPYGKDKAESQLRELIGCDYGAWTSMAYTSYLEANGLRTDMLSFAELK